MINRALAFTPLGAFACEGKRTTRGVKCGQDSSLYDMDMERLVSEDILPKCSRCGECPPKSSEVEHHPDLVVVVDLGNVHDCLSNLLPYARKGLLCVRAYADLAYRGFGVNPSVEGEPNCMVIQSSSAHRNAADSALVWDLALLSERAQRANQRLKFLVVTKDLGFQAVADLAKRHGNHEVIFCTDWRSLRLYVE